MDRILGDDAVLYTPIGNHAGLFRKSEENIMLLNVDRYLSERGLSSGDFQAKLSARPRWFHCFSFTNGCATPGYDPSGTKLTALALPDLHGKSVIDIGAYDGYFSFQAERLGAARVVGTDHFVWTDEAAHLGALGNFELVHEAVGSRVERVDVAVENLPQMGPRGF